MLDDEMCSFKIDTGSDVSILSNRLAWKRKRKIVNENCYLRCPTGGKVFVKSKIFATVKLERYTVKIPLFIAKINDY